MNSKPFNNKEQVKDTKPNIPKTGIIALTPGFWAGSFNGGINHVMGYQYAMAGQYIEKMPYKIKLKILTPKTPAYQPLLITYRVYYVPHKRVMTNYEEFMTRRGGSTIEKIEELPNFGNFTTKKIYDESGEVKTVISNTTLWRDSYVSSYLPRTGNFENVLIENEVFDKQPKTSALPIRGIKAIYNEFLRHKEYDTLMVEYLDDTVTEEEWNSYMPGEEGITEKTLHQQMRARRPLSYYTDYRTELQGFDVEYPPEDMDSGSALMNWTRYFENYIAEARSEAENYQLTTAEAIAKLRGSRELKEGRVQLLATHTFPLNYASITQSTYNEATSNPEYQVMGAQGGYSYTELQFNLIEDTMFIEDGTIHVIANVHAASVFETAYDRMDLNVNWKDLYRPDMKEEKTDVIYEAEYGSQFSANQNQEAYYTVRGFKRKYNEMFKIRNSIKGDLTSSPYYQIDGSEVNGSNDNNKFKEDLVLTQNTYQFFEESDTYFYDEENIVYINKRPWLDYTDLLINKNQAYKNEIVTNDDEEFPYVYINGQNQIDYVGQVQMFTNLPIDGDIKNNVTKWSEH